MSETTEVKAAQSLPLVDESRAQAMAEALDLTNPASIMNFGADAQTSIAKFSDSVLTGVRTSDTGEVGKSLSALVTEVKSFEAQGEKGGFLGIFGSVKKSVDKMAANYAKVEDNIGKIESRLRAHKIALEKDIEMFGRLYDENLSYFKELNICIAAGERRLESFTNQDIPAQQAIAEQSSDQMETQKLNDMLSQAERLDKKLHDLRLSRTISIQMAPQIRLLQNNNAVLAEKIHTSIVSSIPLWKNQMVLALGLSRSKEALAVQSSVTDMTNELLLKNSEALKQGSVDVAKESERSIVSVETIRKTNENLISTISEVLQIQEQGRQSRTAAEGELAKIENDLKGALLSTMKKQGGQTNE